MQGPKRHLLGSSPFCRACHKAYLKIIWNLILLGYKDFAGSMLR